MAFSSGQSVRLGKSDSLGQKVPYFTEQSCRRVPVQNTCSLLHSQLFGACETYATITSRYWANKSEIVYFAPNC